MDGFEARTIGMAAALGSAASWALGSVLFRRLGYYLQPVALTFAKGLASLALLGIALLLVGVEPIGTRDLMLLAGSGLLGIAIGDTLFFRALNSLGAHSVVILFTFGQVLTAILAVMFLGEQPTAQDWTGIGLILTGIATIMWNRVADEGGGLTRLSGAFYGLLSVTAMAVSIIIAKEALEQTNPTQATFIRMLAGTVGAFLFGQMTSQFSAGLQPLRTPRVFGLFAVSVAVVTFGGFWLSLVSIAHVDVAIANTLGATEPLFVLPLAAWYLREKISALVVAASLATLGGIALIAGPW